LNAAQSLDRQARKPDLRSTRCRQLLVRIIFLPKLREGFVGAVLVFRIIRVADTLEFWKGTKIYSEAFFETGIEFPILVRGPASCDQEIATNPATLRKWESIISRAEEIVEKC